MAASGLLSLVKSMPTKKFIFLFLNQNICCGYSKEPSQGDASFEHPKHMLSLMGKKILHFYAHFFFYLNLCSFMSTELSNDSSLVSKIYYRKLEYWFVLRR